MGSRLSLAEVSANEAAVARLARITTGPKPTSVSTSLLKVIWTEQSTTPSRNVSNFGILAGTRGVLGLPPRVSVEQHRGIRFSV